MHKCIDANGFVNTYKKRNPVYFVYMIPGFFYIVVNILIIIRMISYAHPLVCDIQGSS